MPTQEERRTKTVAAIRLHARALFARDGFDATSINAIADAAGIKKGGVYHHFGSKEQLFEAIFRDVEGDLYAAVVRKADLTAAPVDQMVAGTRTFLEECLTPDVRQVVLIDGPRVLGWRRWREIDAEHFLPLIEAGLSVAARNGADVTSLARLLIGATDEAVMVLAEGTDSFESISDGLETMIRSIAAAISVDPGPKPARRARSLR
jgi:AcrR family transcriptional regulator